MSGLHIVSKIYLLPFDESVTKAKSSGKPREQENTNRNWLLYESCNYKCDGIRCLHSTSLQSTWEKNLKP